MKTLSEGTLPDDLYDALMETLGEGSVLIAAEFLPDSFAHELRFAFNCTQSEFGDRCVVGVIVQDSAMARCDTAEKQLGVIIELFLKSVHCANQICDLRRKLEFRRRLACRRAAISGSTL